MGRPRLGLGTKLALAMVGSLTVLLALLGGLYIRHYRASQEALILLSEDRLGEIIRRSTRSAMLRNDRHELAEQLPEIGRMPQLLRVRIYDKSGTIRYSSLPDEVGDSVDMSADACDRCHASAQPLTRLERTDRTRIYQGPEERIMGTIHAIPNEGECAGSGCHAGPEEQAVLGVLDVQMSLRSVDEGVTSRIRSFVLTSILVLGLVSGVSVLWIWRSVARPIKGLVLATRAIAGGDLDQRVNGRFDRELGELVQSFNQMTAALQASRKEADDWARTLEQRVEEKSRALRRAQDDLVQVEKMASLGKLAATVAHEINNPLAGIRTYAKLLLKRLARSPEALRVSRDAHAASATAAVPTAANPTAANPTAANPTAANPTAANPTAANPSEPPSDPAEVQAWLERIESESARCGEIVRNLLSFSRSSEPRIELADVGEVIRQSVRLVQHQFDLSSIRVQLDLCPEAPRIECDPQQIKQALLAMLINACEAMPQGGDLAIACEALEGGAGVELRISDTGIGMDAETRKHLFEPFFTTKEGSSTGGTGLGLAVVYGILQSHGGTITVESAPGRGSRFVLRLPFVHPGTEPESGDVRTNQGEPA